MKQIQIKCEGALSLDYKMLSPFQGALKKLTIENYERLKAELIKDGFCEPISVWKRYQKHEEGHEYFEFVVLNGHQRLATIKEMCEVDGFSCSPLPVSLVDCESEEQANDLVLALTSQYGEMSDASLSKYIQERGLRVREVVQRFRFPETDTENVIRIVEQATRVPGAGEEASDEDEVPAPPVVPKTQRGDLYVLGDHVLLCGDATNKDDVWRAMSYGPRTEKADLIFTDPPYNLASDTSLIAASAIRNSYNRLKESDWDKDFQIRAALDTMLSILAEDSSVYVCTSQFLAGEIWQWMREFSSFYNYVVWGKTNPMPSLTKRHWTWSTELICYATRGKHTFNFPDEGHALSVWTMSKVQKCDLHPTMKPVALVEHAITHSSKPGDIVADFFGGSGTTLIACQKTLRRCRMIEIDPVYVDVIVSRWENLTGQTAEHVPLKEHT